MDAVKFFKEYQRLCKAHDKCDECLLNCFTGCSYNPVKGYSDDKLTTFVEFVEHWSKENPEEIGKKYIIEIDEVDGDTCRVKKAKWWVYRADLEQLEEYKGE